MIRTLSMLALSLFALTANAKDTVVLCKNYDDYASRSAFDESFQRLMEQGYSPKLLAKTVKKSTLTYVGTGLRLGMGPKDRRIIAMGAVAGSPASRIELFEGRAWTVTSIDGVSSLEMDIEDARNLVRGSKTGTGVVLKLVRHSTPSEGREYTRYVERDRITIPVETTCYTFRLTKK